MPFAPPSFPHSVLKFFFLEFQVFRQVEHILIELLLFLLVFKFLVCVLFALIFLLLDLDILIIYFERLFWGVTLWLFDFNFALNVLFIADNTIGFFNYGLVLHIFFYLISPNFFEISFKTQNFTRILIEIPYKLSGTQIIRNSNYQELKFRLISSYNIFLSNLNLA